WRQVEDSSLQRIINTRALFLRDPSEGKYYLRLMDRWLQSDKLDGAWTEVPQLPASIAAVLERLASDPQVNLLDNLPNHVRETLAKGPVPAVTVSTVPAELIETAGPPQLEPIDGTQLLWVTNSTSPLLFDATGRRYYVLLSGRWFRAESL